MHRRPQTGSYHQGWQAFQLAIRQVRFLLSSSSHTHVSLGQLWPICLVSPTEWTGSSVPNRIQKKRKSARRSRRPLQTSIRPSERQSRAVAGAWVSERAILARAPSSSLTRGNGFSFEGDRPSSKSMQLDSLCIIMTLHGPSHREA
jgi:hypothetical protein